MGGKTSGASRDLGDPHRDRRDAVGEAAIERILQRVGTLEDLTDAQARDVAAIALAAMSVDDADRQRRDEAAREHRSRLRRLGRD